MRCSRAWTDELGEQVLRDNYLQTQALSLAEIDGASGVDRIQRLMRAQEKTGRLNRAIEYLPDDDELAVRVASGKGLTRPELAVMLAYAKMALYDELLAGDLPDDPYLVDDLVKYFPRELRRDHKDAVLRHRLRREIIATVATNSIVNRAGIAFRARDRRALRHGPGRSRARLYRRASGLRHAHALGHGRDARQQGARGNPVRDAARGGWARSTTRRHGCCGTFPARSTWRPHLPYSAAVSRS